MQLVLINIGFVLSLNILSKYGAPFKFPNDFLFIFAILFDILLYISLMSAKSLCLLSLLNFFSGGMLLFFLEMLFEWY